MEEIVHADLLQFRHHHRVDVEPRHHNRDPVRTHLHRARKQFLELVATEIDS